MRVAFIIGEVSPRSHNRSHKQFHSAYVVGTPRTVGFAGAVSAPPEYAYVVNVRSVTLQRTSTSVVLEMSFPWERISNKI